VLAVEGSWGSGKGVLRISAFASPSSRRLAALTKVHPPRGVLESAEDPRMRRVQSDVRMLRETEGSEVGDASDLVRYLVRYFMYCVLLDTDCWFVWRQAKDV